MSGLQFVMNLGSWAPQSGRRLWDAVCTGLGKRKMTIIGNRYSGTCTIDGSRRFLVACNRGCWKRRSYARLFTPRKDPDRWESFDEVLRVNPVAAVNPHLRRALEREHKTALQNPIGRRELSETTV